MSTAFAGLRVLDFTTTIAGPHCTRLLADLGADVVKIESPEGDVMRSRPPLRNGASSYFGQLNAGKRSVVLDLKEERAVAAARRLVGEADILVENYRPGVMRRLGLDYVVLGQSNPRLVYCSISGYGQTGPSSDLPAYAPVIHAASGFDLAHLAYQKGRSQPDNCGIYVADVVSGTYAFGAIAAALHQRSVTDRGQHIDVSMLESMLSLTQSELQAAQFEVPPPPSRPIFGPVATADGFLNMAVASERTFQGMAAAAGRPDWITDARFAVYLDRRGNWGTLMDEFEAWSKTRLQCRVPGRARPQRAFRRRPIARCARPWPTRSSPTAALSRKCTTPAARSTRSIRPSACRPRRLRRVRALPRSASIRARCWGQRA